MVLIESLEQRQLLSATANVVGNGVLVIQMDNSGSQVTVFERAQDSGTDLAGNNLVDANGNPVTVANGVTVVDGNGNPVGAGNVPGVGLLPGHFAGINAIVILGGNGNDTIGAITENVPVYIDGGNGNDTIGLAAQSLETDGFHPEYNGSGSVVLGGNDDDNIQVIGISNGLIDGDNGNDTILTGKTLVITGPNPQDVFHAGGENMIVSGDNGNDIIQSGLIDPVIAGQVDLVGLSNSLLQGGNGNDTITDVGSDGTNIVDGGNGADHITVVSGDIVLHSNGHDTIVIV